MLRNVQISNVLELLSILMGMIIAKEHCAQANLVLIQENTGHRYLLDPVCFHIDISKSSMQYIKI